MSTDQEHENDHPSVDEKGDHSKFEDLESRIKKIEGDLKRPPKDFWDKLNTLSGIIAGVFVAAIGFYATQVYDKRSRDAEQDDKNRSVVAVSVAA
jgi:hypothetical protein